MRRYVPDVSHIFEADKISNSDTLKATLRWMEASRSLEHEERSLRNAVLMVAGQLTLAAALAAASSPLYVWLVWLLVATGTVAAYLRRRRSEMRRITGELRHSTKLLYAAYRALFGSINMEGNSTVTAESCALTMTAATQSKTSLLGGGWEKPPIPMAREETVVRHAVKLSLEELTDLIHRILIALLQKEVLPHLPSKTVQIIVDLEYDRVTGKTLIRKAADYVRGTHKAKHTLPYLRVSILPEGLASPAFPVYITIPKREEDAAQHVSRVLESLRGLGLRVKDAYADANMRSTRLFNSLKEAGVTLIARWTKNEAVRRLLTPHLKPDELRAVVDQFSDTLERRIREAEDPKPYLQAKRHVLRGNLAVLGKILAYLAMMDGEFTDVREKFEEWMNSLPKAALWEHTQKSRKPQEEVRLSVGCVPNSTYASTLEALRNPETQSVYFREQKSPKNTRRTVKDREFSPLVFYSGFAAPIPLREAGPKIWEFSLVDLGLKRGQIETGIRESGGFTLECKSTNLVFRLLIKASGEITNLLWRATRVREAGFETLTKEKSWKAEVLILTERGGERRRRGSGRESGLSEEPQPAGVIKTGCTVKIQRFVEKPLTKKRFKKEFLQEHVLFLLVGLSIIFSSDPPKRSKPPPKPPPKKEGARRMR